MMIKKNRPSISVIIPVYNASKYLEKCFDSIIAQKFSDFEVIVIDDGSTDNSYEIMENYAKKDSRFIVETKKNEGPGLTRNAALDKALGEIIVFLDSDDYIEPEYFYLLNKKAIEEYSDVIFIDLIQEDIKGKVMQYETMSNFENKNRHDMIGCQMTGYMPWGGVRKAASRKLIEEKKLRYSSDTVGEEAIFSFELLRNAKKVSFIKKYLYHYVNHSNSQSKSPNGTWEITLKKLTKHLDDNGIRDEYEKSLNAFAFTVLISWLLRNSKNVNLLAGIESFKTKIKEFETNYGWNVEKKYLRKELRILLPLVRIKLLFPIVLAAKVVKRT